MFGHENRSNQAQLHAAKEKVCAASDVCIEDGGLGRPIKQDQLSHSFAFMFCGLFMFEIFYRLHVCSAVISRLTTNKETHNKDNKLQYITTVQIY